MEVTVPIVDSVMANLEPADTKTFHETPAFETQRNLTPEAAKSMAVLSNNFLLTSPSIALMLWLEVKLRSLVKEDPALIDLSDSCN